MIKKIVLIVLLTLLFALSLTKLAFFDPSVIRIDNLVFKRPLFYHYLGEKSEVTLDNKRLDSYTFSFMGVFGNNGATYTIFKELDKVKFLHFSNLVLKNTNSNMAQCNVVINITPVTANDKIIEMRSISLSMFPYVVSFVDTDKDREKSTINQLCGGQEPSYLSVTSRKP